MRKIAIPNKYSCSTKFKIEPLSCYSRFEHLVRTGGNEESLKGQLASGAGKISRYCWRIYTARDSIKVENPF